MKYLSADAALKIILNSIDTLEAEGVLLHECLGQVLAEDVISNDNIPPFDNSAMDGYAVIADDTSGASKENPARLRVTGEQTAGKAYSETVSQGTAVKIMTGAPVPNGADSVVIVENTASEGDEVLIFREAFQGANIRRLGEDVKRGQTTMRKKTVIRPAEMGMLASLGVVKPKVYRKPKVAIVTTGDELVDASKQPVWGQIRNSNQYSLLGQVLKSGCEAELLKRTKDDFAEIEEAMSSAANMADVVIVCGGVSVGERDYVKNVLEKLGEMKFWRTAIKPGKPLAFGSISQKPVFGLPGNPVSSMVTFDIFVLPALRRMMGDETPPYKVVRGVSTDDIRHKPGVREYIRAVTEYVDGAYSSRPISRRGSGILSSMVEANSYIVINEEESEVRVGETVEVVLI